ncbi:polysaccharide pyruvyl transferase-domain-containing protein [Hyaloraphidium curvatum]|nr:polysaccharide pyruvyl transferase-domain-containing protein [Hyaloraphidium curvatum]
MARERLLLTMKAALAGVSKVALVGIPLHGNKGDSAITAGELEVLKQLGISVVYFGVEHDEAEKQATEIEEALPPGPSSAVLYHGGGNFGSIWKNEHGFRLFLVRRLLHRRIVLLPQTILFSGSDRLLQETVDTYALAKDLTIMARDPRSFDILAHRFAQHKIFHCPDSALALGPKNSSLVLEAAGMVQDIDILYLLRVDHESRSRDWSADTLRARHPGLKVEVADWLFYGEPVKDPDPIAANLRRTELGLRFLARARVAVLDRLHGHILASILDVPHAIIDNSYGKLTGFHGAWTLGADNVVVVADVDEASDAAERLLVEAPAGRVQ